MQPQGYQGLHNLIAPKGARSKPKRLGRGESSGHGKTSGRGHKGQKARKSGNVRVGFEGGQNPFARRVPKHGFSNYPFRKEYHGVNLSAISERFESGSVVDLAALLASGLVRKSSARVKVLGSGECEGKFTVRVHAISESAAKKIESAGGKVELIGKE